MKLIIFIFYFVEEKICKLKRFQFMTLNLHSKLVRIFRYHPLNTMSLLMYILPTEIYHQ